MRLHLLLWPVVAAGVLAGAASAQPGARIRIPRADGPFMGIHAFAGDDNPRAALGISTSTSGGRRDTLGLLITSVVPGSPAEKAGIEEGNRLVAIDGVDLKVSAADAEDWEMSGVMHRRLTRQLNKVRPGDDVELKVYAGGQMKTVKVKTVDPEDLYRRRSDRWDDDRATLGFGVASTGSVRDTLGVLVLSVIDSGPAARAGLEEGNRIAAVNGVDLRVDRADAGDAFVANSKARRLQREISRLKAGDDAELRVYANGQTRTVKLRAVRASDLPRRHGSVFIVGDEMEMPPMPAMGLDIDGSRIGADVRRAIERAMDGVGRGLEGIGRVFEFDRNHFDEDDDDLGPHNALRAPAPPGARTPAPPARAVYRSAAFPAAEAPAVFAAIDDNPVSSSSDNAIDIAGLELARVGPELAAYLGKGSDRGLLVVSAPSWAQEGGIRGGDVLLSIDGRPVRSGSGRGTHVRFDLGKEQTVELLRDGSKRTVRVAGGR